MLQGLAEEIITDRGPRGKRSRAIGRLSLDQRPERSKKKNMNMAPLCKRRRKWSGGKHAPAACLSDSAILTWLDVVGVTALLSGVLARARAVASSLCVMGRGPAAPLWLSDMGRMPAEPPARLGGPAGLPC